MVIQNMLSFSPNTGVDRYAIVEASSHFKIVEQLRFLLGQNTEVSILLRRVHSSQSVTDFIDTRALQNGHIYLPISKLPKIFSIFLFYFRFVKISIRSNVIIVCTGPEHVRGVEALLFTVLSYFFRKKILLIIRNAEKYFKDDESRNFDERLGQASRIRLARMAHSLGFETETQRRFFLKSVVEPNDSRPSKTRTIVLYDRYSDYAVSTGDPGVETVDDATLNIGLLGSIDSGRKDYSIVYNALALIPADKLKGLKISILGSSMTPEGMAIISNLRRITKVDVISPLLTERQFQKFGSRCQVLLSPLSARKHYGTANGTGSFGDAVFLRKPLLIPAFVDPDQEFYAFSTYFSNARELANELEYYLEKRQQPLTPSVFERFSSPRVRQELELLFMPKPHKNSIDI
jgi:hypothetical protein